MKRVWGDRVSCPRSISAVQEPGREPGLSCDDELFSVLHSLPEPRVKPWLISYFMENELKDVSTFGQIYERSTAPRLYSHGNLIPSAYRHLQGPVNDTIVSGPNVEPMERER